MPAYISPAVQIKTALDRLAAGEAFEVVARETNIQAVVAELVQQQAQPHFMLIQEGGSSDELYVHAHGTMEEAQADRVSCTSDGAYRTTPPVEVPGDLAHHPAFYETVERILASMSDLDLVVDPDDETPDEDEAAHAARPAPGRA